MSPVLGETSSQLPEVDCTVTLKDVETRFLNWLLKRCPLVADGPTVVELESTKRVLAAELGTSSETLSRTLAKLRDDQLLEIRGASLRLRDVTALQARFRRLLGEG